MVLYRHEKTASRRFQTQERSYQLVDFRFRLRTPVHSVASDAHQLFDHLSVPDSRNSDTIIELVEDGNQWELLHDDEVIDSSTIDGIVPMLHGNVLLTAYRSSDCMAALRAATVTCGDECLLIPAATGTGKTTLTAALMAHGFCYGSDDLVLLTREPVQIRPVPTPLSVKTGSWHVLGDLFSEILQLPIYVRADGKRVRYLSPRGGISRPSDSYKAKCAIFPSWVAGSSPQLRHISGADALARLTSSGYDLPNRMGREVGGVVESLVHWLSELPCFELRYGCIDDAVKAIVDLTSGAGSD